MRAAHQVLDSAPRVLEDPLAVALLGTAAVQRINDAVNNYHTFGARALRAHVVLRSRFAEDRLAAAVNRGVTQYVVLGAGFDTFAFRQPAWAHQLRIIEVDHAGTQAIKRARLAAAGLSIPENVTFATIDFEHESLRDGFRRYQISLDEPTFFSWLGVTMYLEEDAIDAVLATVAAFPTGNEIVLTFAPPPGDSPLPLEYRAASLGEPWVSHFTPDEIDAKLRSAGFSRVEFLSPEEADVRYFQQGSHDLPIPKQTNIAWAIL